MDKIPEFRSETEAVLKNITALLDKVNILDEIKLESTDQNIQTDLTNIHIELLLIGSFTDIIKKKIEKKIVENTPEIIDH